MELNNFPVHGRGLFPRMLIAHLDFAGDEIKDVPVTVQDFFADKQKHGGRFGHFPALKMPDGFVMSETNSICRFLAKKYKAKDGSSFYPGHSDPLLTYWIDQFVDQ